MRRCLQAKIMISSRSLLAALLLASLRHAVVVATTLGCTCSTSCGYDNVYGYSWCKTSNNCGQQYSSFLSGSYSWDQCGYTWQNQCSTTCTLTGGTCPGVDDSTAGSCRGSSVCAAGSNTGLNSYCTGSAPYPTATTFDCTVTSGSFTLCSSSGRANGVDVTCYYNENDCETQSSNCGTSFLYTRCRQGPTNGASPCTGGTYSWYCPVGIPSAPALPSPPPPSSYQGSSTTGSTANCYSSTTCLGACSSGYFCSNQASTNCLITPATYNYMCMQTLASYAGVGGACYTTSNCANACPSGFLCSDQTLGSCESAPTNYDFMCISTGGTPSPRASPPPLSLSPPPPAMRLSPPLPSTLITAPPPPLSNVGGSCYTGAVNFGSVPNRYIPLASGAVCIRYCYACSIQSIGSAICTASETATGVIKVIYDEADTATAASFSASFASVYEAQYNFFSCSSNLCNYDSATTCPARSASPPNTPGSGNMYGSPSMGRSARKLLQPVVAVATVMIAVKLGM